MTNQYIRRGVIAIIVKDSKVIMGKKGNRPGHFLNNAWHFPGGKAEGDEAIEDTLIREMKEELSMDLTIVKKLSEYELVVGDSKSHGTVFLCVSDDEPKASDDLVDAKYFSYDEILELHHKESFEKLPLEVKEFLKTLK